MLTRFKNLFCFGVVWLFLFSLPVGYGKNLFDLAQFYVVKTAPINWALEKITFSYSTTKEITTRNADLMVQRVARAVNAPASSIQANLQNEQ